jgi:hypothetical protein
MIENHGSGIYYLLVNAETKHQYIIFSCMPCQVQIFDLLLEPLLSNRRLTERLLDRKISIKSGLVYMSICDFVVGMCGCQEELCYVLLVW